jgi:hypothetical protein
VQIVVPDDKAEEALAIVEDYSARRRARSTRAEPQA